MSNLDLTFDFRNLSFNIITIVFGIYLIAIGVAYYFIFHKHHKRNKIEFDELITLITKFYTLTMLTTILIAVGIFCIIKSNTYKDDRTQVVAGVLLGIAIISITIINYVFYIKRSLKDLVQEEREVTRKAILKFGEVLELIFFIIFILMPIWRIPKFIELFETKKELIIELIRSFALSIASMILLISINPIDIKGKLFSRNNTEIKNAEDGNNSNDAENIEDKHNDKKVEEENKEVKDMEEEKSSTEKNKNTAKEKNNKKRNGSKKSNNKKTKPKKKK